MRTDLRAVAVLTFGAAVIGLAPIGARLTETGPAAAGFWRLLLAAPLLALLAFRPGAGDGDERRGPNRWALGAGLLFALDMGFWHYGLTYTSVANATVLTNLTPIVVTAAAWLLFREQPRRLFLAALALAVGGAVLMATAQGSGGRGTNPPLGDALSTLTALWYGGYFLLVRQARRDHSATSVMFWTGTVGAPLLLAAALILREDLLPKTGAGWAACVGLGLVHVAGQGSIAWSLGRLPTALASVTVLLQPVVAALLGWLLFAERIVPDQALGAAVLLAGVVLAQLSAKTKTGGARSGAPPVKFEEVSRSIRL